MSRFVIGIDLDDCLADFISAFTKMANAKYGTPAVGTQPVDWAWSNFGLSREQQDSLWADIKQVKRFWVNLELEPGFSPSLLREMDEAHEVYFPTARVDTVGRNARKQSSEWVYNWTGIRYPAVIAAYEKGPMATALKYDFFLDDRPKNCIDIHNALPNCRVYLKNSSHNAAFEAPEWLVRVQDFDAFAKIVNDASQEG
jgi:5'(3')-deoxyribonucleotidase